MKVRPLSQAEQIARERVTRYMEKAQTARALWYLIKQTHPGWMSRQHPEYDAWIALQTERNDLARMMVGNKPLYREFIAAEKGRGVSWRTLMRQSKQAAKKMLSETRHHCIEHYHKKAYQVSKLWSTLSHTTQGSDRDALYQTFQEARHQRNSYAQQLVAACKMGELRLDQLGPGLNWAKINRHAAQGVPNQDRSKIEVHQLQHNTRIRYHDVPTDVSMSSSLVDLIHHLTDRIDEMAYDLLGVPSYYSATEWRYEEYDSLSIKVSGIQKGLWSNFETGQSGGVLQLIQSYADCHGDALQSGLEWLGKRREERDRSTFQSTMPISSIISDIQKVTKQPDELTTSMCTEKEVKAVADRYGLMVAIPKDCAVKSQQRYHELLASYPAIEQDKPSIKIHILLSEIVKSEVIQRYCATHAPLSRQMRSEGISGCVATVLQADFERKLSLSAALKEGYALYNSQLSLDIERLRLQHKGVSDTVLQLLETQQLHYYHMTGHLFPNNQQHVVLERARQLDSLIGQGYIDSLARQIVERQTSRSVLD